MSHSRESSNAWKDLPVIPFRGELRFSISSLIHIIAITKLRSVNEIFQRFNGEILYPLYHIHEFEEHIVMIFLPDCGTALQSKEEQVILFFILKQNNIYKEYVIMVHFKKNIFCHFFLYLSHLSSLLLDSNFSHCCC